MRMAAYGLMIVVLYACEGNDFPDINTCENPPVLSVARISQPVSCQEADGSIEVIVSGGVEPNRYTHNGQDTQSSGLFTDLLAGTHVIVVLDKSGCGDTLTVELFNSASTLSAIVATEPNTECLDFNGTLSITALDGSPPYLYSLNDGAFTDVNRYDNLPPGILSIRVKDAQECMTEIAAEIPRGNTGVSWNINVKTVFLTRCAKSGCHDGNSGRPALISYEQVFELRSQIRSRVASGSMPFDGPLPPGQKAQILCWLDDGAPEN